MKKQREFSQTNSKTQYEEVKSAHMGDSLSSWVVKNLFKQGDLASTEQPVKYICTHNSVQHRKRSCAWNPKPNKSGM